MRELDPGLVLIFWALVVVLALTVVNLLRGDREQVTTGLLLLIGITGAVRLLLAKDP